MDISVLLLAGSINSTVLANTQQDGPIITHTISLNKNIYGLFTIETSVGRQVVFHGDPEAAPIPFILDTGASHTAVPRLIANQLAEEEAISLDEIGHGMTSQFNTGLVIADEIDFGFGPRSVEVAVIEESYGSVLSAAGILGANAFQSEIIRLEFASAELQLLSGLSLLENTGLRVENGLVMGEGRMRGVTNPVKVLIDTGATASIVNSAFLTRRSLDSTIGSEIAGLDGTPEVDAYVRRIFSGLRIDNLCINLFEVSVADVYAFEVHGWLNEPAIILGMDALRNSAITIDYATGRVHLDGQREMVCRTSR